MSDRKLTEAQEQAQAALDKVMNSRFSNFDAGAVIHWAERGMYQVKVDVAQPATAEPLADVVAVNDTGNSITLHFSKIKSAKAFRDTLPVAATPSPLPQVVGSKAEAFDRICAARKKHVDAVAAYNARRELANAERMRGSLAIKLDDEYRAMSDAQADFHRTVQDACDAALATATEGSGE